MEKDEPSRLFSNPKRRSQSHSGVRMETLREINPAYDEDIAEDERHSRCDSDHVRTGGRCQKIHKWMNYAKFCVVNYYTSPIFKFIWYTVRYSFF